MTTPAQGAINAQEVFNRVPLAVHGPRAEFHLEQHIRKQQMHPFDVGFDLFPNGEYEEELDGVESRGYLIRLKTGVKLTPIPGSYITICERSSSVIKLRGGRVMSGIIDPGYTGFMDIRVFYPQYPLPMAVGEVTCKTPGQFVAELVDKALAQAILMPYLIPDSIPYEEKAWVGVGRHEAGYGSTDKR